MGMSRRALLKGGVAATVFAPTLARQAAVEDSELVARVCPLLTEAMTRAYVASSGA